MANEENNTDRARLGDFEILGELGRGGMGVVYRALQLSLNRRVALKVLRGSFTLAPGSVERFKREAAAAARLHHTHIVPVYATGTVEDQHYYAMELIDGCSLDRVLEQIRTAQSTPELKVPPLAFSHEAENEDLEQTVVDHSVPEQTSVSSLSSSHSSWSTASGSTGGRRYFDAVARLIADVADALEYAHGQGVVHRDIKPANLILSNANRVYVTDFGLARLQEADGLTATGGVMGSPHYMSPEQVTPNSPELDHRTDIYSLGVTLYEMLALKSPFKGASKELVLNHILTKEPVRPRRVDRHIPQDLETICLKAMDKRPDRRYQTAREFADDLRRYVNRFTIAARRVSLGERAFRWSQRHPSTAGLIVASLIATGALSGLWVVNKYRVALQAALGEAELANEEAERQKNFGQYIVNINRTYHSLERDNAPRAGELLRAIHDSPGQKRMIGFEWGFLLHESEKWRRADLVKIQAANTLSGCDFTPDGTIAAISGKKSRILLKYGMPRSSTTNQVWLDGHTNWVNRVRFSRDGNMLASSSDDGRVMIWDMSVRPPRNTGVFESHDGPVYGIDFDSDGTHLAGATDGGSVKVWDVRKGIEVKTLAAHDGRARSVRFSHEGPKLLASCGVDGFVRVWDADSYEPISRVEAHVDAAHTIDFSRTDGLLASGGGDGMIKIWNPTNLSEITRMASDQITVTSLEFSPSGRWIASGGVDKTVRIWDVPSRTEVEVPFGHQGTVNNVAFAEDGRGLVSVGWDGAAKLWDLGRLLSQSSSLRLREGEIWSLGISPDGKWMSDVGSIRPGFTNKVLRLWNLDKKDGRPLELNRWSDSIFGIMASSSFSRDGRWLAAPNGGELLLWDMTTRARVNLVPPISTNDLMGVRFSPTEDLLATWGRGGEVQFYNIDTEKWIWSLSPTDKRQMVLLSEFTPDGGQFAAVAGNRREVVVANVMRQRIDARLSAENLGAIECIAISDDSKRLVVGTIRGRVVAWDLDSDEIIFDASAHFSRVNAVALVDQGKTIVSASVDKTIKFWRVEMNQMVVSLEVESRGRRPSVTGITDLKVSPDGLQLFSAAGESMIRVWPTTDVISE